MDGGSTSPWIEAAESLVGTEAETAADEAGFPQACVDLLRGAGLRPTRQRLMLSQFLFAGGNRHVTADMVYVAAVEANLPVSRATVYNTLNQLTEAGLLRQIGVDGSRSFFDTTPTNHHHFFVSDENHLFDVPEPGVEFSTLPEPLPGYEIAGVDVIVHLRRTS
jgi:Fur family iron response transcriptional regulator